VPLIVLDWDRAQAGASSGEAQSAEKEAFEAAKELGTVEAWDAFLGKYPSGFYAELARAYVKKLAGGPAAAAPPAAPSSAPAQAEQAAYENRCSARDGLRSRESRQPARIRFINQTQSTLVLQWIDFNGQLKEYGEIRPGAETVQETYITHPWVVAWQEGSCRQIFLPAEGTSVARLLPMEKETTSDDEPAKRKASQSDDDDDDRSAKQRCRDAGKVWTGSKCVSRKEEKADKPSKATIEKRAKAACVDMGMIYLNGKCAPKTKKERDAGSANKNKACPAGMYRNPYGQCQPNETGG
jgi:hypothetical protein